MTSPILGTKQAGRTVVLGLSFDYHDSAAALLVDGAIVAAAQEERFTRVKHDATLPVQAIDWCMRHAALPASAIDAVVFYENPFLKFDRILWASQQRHPESRDYLRKTAKEWVRKGKFDVSRRIADAIGVPAERVHAVRHHHAHAASAFYCSPFDTATVVTLDGVGEYETATIGVGDSAGLRMLSSTELPHSLGLFYSAMTAYLGFEVNDGEYKVMGMAAYGSPVFYDEFRRLITVRDDGTFRIDQDCFEFLTPEKTLFTPALIERLGPPRHPEAPFSETSASAENRRHADIAASVQKCVEDVILEIVDRAVDRTGSRNVCLAGGVALNSLANGRLRRERDYGLYVQPAAGDAGGAIGAACLHHHETLGRAGRTPLRSCQLGRSFDADAIERAVADSGYEVVRRFDDDRSLVEHVAARLADGAVIGWFQGRAEWGPRALGNRSILADPRRAEMKSIVNEKIKFREPFRPFAPAVPVEHAQACFDMPPAGGPADPERFMLCVHPVRPAMRETIPAIVHGDGTARVQVVSSDENPLFHALLMAFNARTGVPVLLNTSFNLRGEPIVDAPADALKTFSRSNMDDLVLGRLVVSQEYRL